MRAVNMAEQRILEAKKLGFTTCILPAVCLDQLADQIRDQIKDQQKFTSDGMKLIGVKSVQDAIDLI